jgi:hypothetical protein
MTHQLKLITHERKESRDLSCNVCPGRNRSESKGLEGPIDGRFAFICEFAQLLNVDSDSAIAPENAADEPADIV